jgi:hypothetical protein
LCAALEFIKVKSSALSVLDLLEKEYDASRVSHKNSCVLSLQALKDAVKL